MSFWVQRKWAIILKNVNNKHGLKCVNMMSPRSRRIQTVPGTTLHRGWPESFLLKSARLRNKWPPPFKNLYDYEIFNSYLRSVFFMVKCMSRLCVWVSKYRWLVVCFNWQPGKIIPDKRVSHLLGGNWLVKMMPLLVSSSCHFTYNFYAPDSWLLKSRTVFF